MQRDYVLRMIEQIAASIARMRQRILGGSAEAEAELQAMAGIYGVDLPTARAIDGGTLLLLVSPGGQPEASRTWVMAEMLYLDALRLASNGDAEEAHHGFAKSLLLYGTIDATMLGGLPEAKDRMAELRDHLHAVPPTVEN